MFVPLGRLALESLWLLPAGRAHDTTVSAFYLWKRLCALVSWCVEYGKMHIVDRDCIDRPDSFTCLELIALS
jgi:hypothetical protein